MKYLLLIAALFLTFPVFAQVSDLPLQPAGTITVSVTTSASTAAVLTRAGSSTWQVMIVNSTTQLVFCKFGPSTVAAAITDTPILGSASRVFSVDGTHNYISCITPTGTSTVYATGGLGR